MENRALKNYEFQSEHPRDKWNHYASGFKDYHIFQSYEFGETYRNSADNAKINRYILFNDSNPAVMGQVICKELRFMSAAFLWIKGGPLFNSSEDRILNTRYLKRFLVHLTDSVKSRYKQYYINVQMNTEADVQGKLMLREIGWKKPLIERNPFLTYIVPISNDIGKNMKTFNSKWRNQLKRAERFCPHFEWGNSDMLIDRYKKLHGAMSRIKNNGSLSSIEDLYSIRRCLNNNLQVLIGSIDNEDVCGCVLLLFNRKAYYLYAASNEKGRSTYSSNAMIWNAIKRLHEGGISELDLLGVDPFRNWGGYHFKKGIGGRPVEFLGEWEYYSNSYMRLFMNLLLEMRNRFRAKPRIKLSVGNNS